jgi:hypothetical protein
MKKEVLWFYNRIDSLFLTPKHATFQPVGALWLDPPALICRLPLRHTNTQRPEIAATAGSTISLAPSSRSRLHRPTSDGGFLLGGVVDLGYCCHTVPLCSSSGSPDGRLQDSGTVLRSGGPPLTSPLLARLGREVRGLFLPCDRSLLAWTDHGVVVDLASQSP